MTEQTAEKPQYLVEVYDREDGSLVFSFYPKSLQDERGPRAIREHAPIYAVAVRQEGGGLSFDWSGTPDNPGAASEGIQVEIAARMADRSLWIDRVTSLADRIEQWAREMNWATRRVEKKLVDTGIGSHRVPALLMQEDTCRILLEPIGRSGPGAEGVVDLYLMPAYDDIARLDYRDNQWNLYYQSPGTKSATTAEEAEPTPLSKEAFERVLAEMRQHVA